MCSLIDLIEISGKDLSSLSSLTVYFKFLSSHGHEYKRKTKEN